MRAQRNVSGSPALKKQIANWQHQINDLGRRDIEHRASAAAYRAKYDALCRDLGIPVRGSRASQCGRSGSESHDVSYSAVLLMVAQQGENVPQELAQLVLGLPQLYDELLVLLRGSGVSEAAVLYTEFVRFIRSANGGAGADLVGYWHQQLQRKRRG